ncbi:MAG: amino acid ABC transporter permease [Deltaproteobacteria bacterium]|nr:MAG: amino acid ABC transporter permease [Deltaproteobacteria bacterium]
METWKKTLQQIGVVAGLALIILGAFTRMDFGYDFHWAVLWEVNPTYKEVFGYWLLRGLVVTVQISLISAAVALVLGTLLGIARLSTFKPLRGFATAYVEFFRNTPLLVQLFFWYFAFPVALPESASAFLYRHNFEFWAATGGLSIYTASFIAEVVRAGIQAIPRGHLEAAAASGLHRLQTLRFVILPQAFRIIIPPLGSEFLNNMKNSSLAMTIGVADLCWQAQQIESFTFRGFEATTAATVIYLSLSLLISLVMNSVNHHLTIGDQRPLSFFDRALGAAVRPLAIGAGAGWRVMRRVWPPAARRRSPKVEEALYISSGKQILARLWRLGIVAGRLVFVLLLLLLLAALGKVLWSFNWGVIAANLRALLIWTFPRPTGGEIFLGLGGLALSIVLAAISLTVSFGLGLAAGLGRLSRHAFVSTPSILYIELIRGNPLIMVIFWVYFFSPILTGMQIDVFWSATIAFTVFSGAYLAEIVRAGVSAIPHGQMEAAVSSGLSYIKAMRLVILPQALKIMIPAIVGQFIALFKDTSLAYIIGVFELTTVAQTINNRLMIYPFEIYTTIAVLYFVCCYAMSDVARRLERKYSPDKRVQAPRMA